MEHNLEDNLSNNNIWNNTPKPQKYDFSHEIMCYINIIQNMNSIIECEYNKNIYSQTIKSSCQKITNILEMASNENIIDAEHNKPIDIRDVLIELSLGYDKECQKRNTNINVNVESTIINANEKLINRLFINIMQRLLQLNKNGYDINITSKFTYPNLYIKFWINDNILIKLKDIDICKKCIKKLGGELFDEDNDSIITLQLPIHPKLIQHKIITTQNTLKEC